MEDKEYKASEDQLQEGKRVKRKKIIILLVSLVGFNFFVWGTLYLALSNRTESPRISLKGGPNIQATPTPFPFQEMTIPYLRSREYKSLLSELFQVSQNADYTSYLTSYTSDGLKINGLLTIPKEDSSAASSRGGQAGQAKKYPAIILVHGYVPPQNYQTLVNYSQYVDYLARRGFIVFKIDLRGHGSSEGEPGGGYYSADYIIDTLNARAALQQGIRVNLPAGKARGEGESLETIRIGKIGLWGHSMAGNVVARALAASPEIPAVVIFAGAVYTYSDFSEFSIDDNSYQPPPSDSPSRKKRNEMFELYGQFDPTSPFWKQVPMTNYLDEIKGAISLNHALDDGVVDIRYSRNLNSLLNQTSIPHELNEYPSGGHNFTGKAFNQAMQNTVEFFTTHLK